MAAARDLDGDGRPEFLVGSRIRDTFSQYDHGVTIFEAAGDDAYAPVWELRGDDSFASTHLAVGDVDGDEAEEFAVTIPGGIELYEAFGDDDFRLVGKVPYTSVTVQGPFPTPLADLDGDGVDELFFNGDFDADHYSVQIHIRELADLQPPVLIPAWFPLEYGVGSGEPLTARADLSNRTDAVQRVDLWVETYRGGGQGGPHGELLDRELLLSKAPLPPGRTVGHRFGHLLPHAVGLYTVQLKVGRFPDRAVDTRWFTVAVIPAS